MKNQIKENRKMYHEAIINRLSHFSYRKKRYKLNFSIAIGLCDEQINLSEFIEIKRKTDDFIVLQNNLCCIIFDGADSDSAIKAAANMQTDFQYKYFNKKIFVSVVAAEDYDDDIAMVNSLFDILDYAISNDLDNIVIDKNQMFFDRN